MTYAIIEGPWCNTWDDPLTFEIEDLRVVADRRVGVAFAIATMGSLAASGDTVCLRVIWGFERLAGGWRVIVDHSSVPASLENGKSHPNASPAPVLSHYRSDVGRKLAF